MSNLHLKPQPTLGDVQQYVTDMEAERDFTDSPLLEQFLLLVEEVGELGKVIRKQNSSLGIDTNKQYDFDAAGEIADVLIMLCAVANRLGVDIEQALRDKEEQNKKRTWK
jgi:NTP pyrophosphatase (non-canonical NTP hydrolase)